MQRYVAFLCLGMAEIGIKNMVSVPVGMSVPCPWQRQPISSAQASIQRWPSLQVLNL